VLDCGAPILGIRIEIDRRHDGLRELLLSYCRFTDKGLAMLQPLQKLERLELTRTRTTDVGVQSLAALTNLASLDLDYTTVTDKGLDL